MLFTGHPIPLVRRPWAARLLSALLLWMSGAAVQAQFSYVTNQDTITITGYTGPGGEVIIPGSINDLPVTAIGDRAFYNSPGVTSITTPDSVTSVGDWAFAYCAQLDSIRMPGNVTAIGNHAFSHCTSLTNDLSTGAPAC